MGFAKQYAGLFSACASTRLRRGRRGRLGRLGLGLDLGLPCADCLSGTAACHCVIVTYLPLGECSGFRKEHLREVDRETDAERVMERESGCVCVRERARGREREHMCVCVCV